MRENKLKTVMIMIAHSKTELRMEMLAKRGSIDQNSRAEKSTAIKEMLFGDAQIKSAGCIAFYISKGSEVETDGMIQQAMEQGKEVLVPHTNDRIELVKFTSFEDLAPAKFGIPEPKTKTKSGHQPDVVIVPGLAFDLDLHRLGYGKGHYDMLLKKLKCLKVGICFDMQIVDNIPRHEHDEKMNAVLSEKRLLR